ncbi:MAG: cytidine deaminase [bacterium]|nr:cytidine deaminase [bacterium]
MSESKYRSLLEQAKIARGFAHAKYSHFQVGAALLTASGKIYTGSNVESSSYGLSICAERVALVKALSEGESEFTAIAVIADTKEPVSPCGACRQLLHDYAPQAAVVLGNTAGDFRESTVANLLPDAFDDNALIQTKQPTNH